MIAVPRVRVATELHTSGVLNVNLLDDTVTAVVSNAYLKSIVMSSSELIAAFVEVDTASTMPALTSRSS